VNVLIVLAILLYREQSRGDGIQWLALPPWLYQLAWLHIGDSLTLEQFL